MKKKSFTLIELMICLAIIGIILGAAIPSIKTAVASYTSLTYYAFNSVKTMAQVMRLSDSIENRNRNNFWIDKCSYSGGTWSKGIIKPDFRGALSCSNDYLEGCSYEGQSGEGIQSNNGIVYCNPSHPDRSFPENDNDFNFCKRLTYIANTSGRNNCAINDLQDVGITEASIDGYAVPYITSFNPDNYNFVTTNGQRWYISRRHFDNHVSEDFGFRLIAIDLNGKRGPNVLSPRHNETSDNNRQFLPDIITFLVLDTGDVFPIGAAGNNVRDGNKYVNYLNSRAIGYNYSSGRGTNANRMCMYEDGKRQCAFTIEALLNSNSSGQPAGNVGSYRYKFCQAGNTTMLSNYCTGYRSRSQGMPEARCPGGIGPKDFDECLVEPVKPLFRFNL